MEKLYHKLFKNTLSIALTVIIASLFCVEVIWATTTIGTNISTGGTLSVTGLSTFSRATSTSATTTEYLYVGYDGTEPAGWDFAGGDLYVGGAAYFNAKATSSTAFAVGSPTGNYVDFASGDLIVQGDAEFDSNLYLAGRATSTSATTTAYLYVGHDVSEPTGWDFAGGDLLVAGDAYFNNKATTSVAIILGSPTANYVDFTGGDLITQGDVEIDGNLYLAGRATSTSATTTNYLYVGYDISEPTGWDFSGGDLIVVDDVYIGSQATTSGAAIIGSPTTNYIDYAGGDLIVQGDAEFDSNLYLAGRATSTSATTTNYLEVGSAFSLPSSIDYVGDLMVFDDAVINGRATATEALWVGSAGTASNIDLSNDLYVYGDTEIDGGLWVNSATTTDTLSIGGNATTSGETVLNATAPSAQATTTITFGSYSTPDQGGLCLKFHTAGYTVYCWLKTNIGATETSTPFWCSTTKCD